MAGNLRSIALTIECDKCGQSSELHPGTASSVSLVDSQLNHVAELNSKNPAHAAGQFTDQKVPPSIFPMNRKQRRALDAIARRYGYCKELKSLLIMQDNAAVYDPYLFKESAAPVLYGARPIFV